MLQMFGFYLYILPSVRLSTCRYIQNGTAEQSFTKFVIESFIKICVHIQVLVNLEKITHISTEYLMCFCDLLCRNCLHICQMPLHTHTHTFTHIHTHSHTYTHIHTHTHTFTYIHTFTHIHTHSHTAHTHSHTYTHT